jgi:hypothetical protein
MKLSSFVHATLVHYMDREHIITNTFRKRHKNMTYVALQSNIELYEYRSKKNVLVHEA